MRVGIPRALCYYQYYPLLATFFGGLGAELVVSAPTSKPMLAAGLAALTAETCLPVKAYFGHALALRDRVDFIFVPSLRSTIPDLYNCVKLFALPDMIRAALRDGPPMLDMLWDVNLGYKALRKELRRVAARIGSNRRAVEPAIERALQAHEGYLALLRNRLAPPAAMEQMGFGAVQDAEDVSYHGKASGDLLVALIGHPYMLFDAQVNHNLLKRLIALGVTVVTAQMLADEQQVAGAGKIIGDLYWMTEKEITGAAGHYMFGDETDGVIMVTAFGCGPDSTMIDAVQRAAARNASRPVLALVLDEHTAEAGLVTRLEAFVDMLRRRGPKRFLPVPVLFSAGRKGPMANPVVTFPHMGTVHVPVRVLLNRLGVPMVVPPPCSKRSLARAAQFSPEQACIPYKLTLGNFLEALDQGANTTLLLSGPNNCRFGYYHKLQEQVLRDLGYEFHMALPQISGRTISGLVALLRDFSGSSWKDCVTATLLALSVLGAMDSIERRVQWLRPRELAPGMANKIWREALDALCLVRTQGELRALKRGFRDRIAAVAIDEQRDPVRVCIVGEVYVVQEPYINQDVESELGKLGVEARRSEQLSRWIALSPHLILEGLGLGHHARIRKAERGYLEYWSGETIGQTVLAERDGFDGVIQLAPFTCTPEIVAQNVLPLLRAEHDVPVLTLVVDEHTAHTGVRTRLEAFVDFLDRRRAKRGRLPGSAVRPLLDHRRRPSLT